MRTSLLSLSLVVTAGAVACGDDDVVPTTPDAGGTGADAAATPDARPDGVPSSYAFDSRFEPGASAVSYSGQSFRHALIAELTAYVGGLTDVVDTTPPADGEVLSALSFYFDFDSATGGAVELTLATDPPLLQTTFDDVSSGKDLRSKLAGNDAATDHKVWNTPGAFQGWSEGGDAADTPTELVQYWFGTLDDLAFERGLGTVPLDPTGAPIGNVYITARGQDLRQLIQKFLLGAIAFSQGADDYLDDDVVGKGLLSSNLQDGDNPYSALEHAFDEGFGYFGGARDYADYSDDELAAKGGRADYQGYHDTNGDNAIDVKSEINFGNSVNCAKRDRGSSDQAPTDFTLAAFDAFLAGRHLIWSTDGELDQAALAELAGYRDAIVQTWEHCVAATVVHYINDVLADMDTFDSGEYSFEDHAKHWSELKGFALGLQFNPRSPLNSGTLFADFHALIGDAPVLPNAATAAITQYRADLEAARDIVKTAYGFAEANVLAW